MEKRGKRITIVGGGLAGLTLGIGLRQLGVPVVVFEAGDYPRHRVCGEFISGSGIRILQKLGLRNRRWQAGSQTARAVRFFFDGAACRLQTLPTSAESISRFELDQMLATEFKRLGGQLLERERWRGDFHDEGIVRANGRRADAAATRRSWIGLKAHARNVELTADLEMHAEPGGYTGLSRLPDGAVNVCGIFRPGPLPTVPDKRCRERAAQGEASGRAEKILLRLRGSEGSAIYRTLARATFDPDSICAVSAIDLRPHRGIQRTDLSIGDALTMTPPVTGNGMSMAFESAAWAIEPIAKYSVGDLSWAEARFAAASRCDKAFRRRLTWARWLHWLMLMPGLPAVTGQALGNSPWFVAAMFERTR